MTHVRELLINQFQANADDPGFYAPLSAALQDLTEQDGGFKVHPEAMTILELVNHLIYWNRTWQHRYRNKDFKSVESIDNDDTFLDHDNSSFENKKNELIELLLYWNELLEESQLDEGVEGFPVDAKWWELISNAAAHNSYHIGQIVFIRKVIDSKWKSDM